MNKMQYIIFQILVEWHNLCVNNMRYCPWKRHLMLFPTLGQAV